jgi:hypothetical protein
MLREVPVVSGAISFWDSTLAMLSVLPVDHLTLEIFRRFHVSHGWFPLLLNSMVSSFKLFFAVIYGTISFGSVPELKVSTLVVQNLCHSNVLRLEVTNVLFGRVTLKALHGIFLGTEA